MDECYDDFWPGSVAGCFPYENGGRVAPDKAGQKQARCDEFRGRVQEEKSCRTCHRFWGFVRGGFCCNADESVYTDGYGWCPNHEIRSGACVVFSDWEPPEEKKKKPAPRKKQKGVKEQ